jgi:hypothetical protein
MFVREVRAALFPSAHGAVKSPPEFLDHADSFDLNRAIVD